GRMQMRAQGTGSLTAGILERTTVVASADAAPTPPLDGPHGAHLIRARLTVGHNARKFIIITVGLLAAGQRSQHQLTGSLPLQWFAFVGAMVRALPLRF